MADDLDITASFDASGIIQGAEQAENAVKSSTDQIKTSFQSVTQSSETAELAFSKALDALVAPMLEASSTLTGVTIPAINAFSTALDSTLAPLQAAAVQIEALTPAEEAFAAAFEASLAGVNNSVTSLQAATSAEAAFATALDATIEPMIAADVAAARMDEALAIMSSGQYSAAESSNALAQAEENVSAAIGPMATELAEMAEAQAAVAEEAQLAAAATQQQIAAQEAFANSMSGVLQQMAAAQQATVAQTATTQAATASQAQAATQAGAATAQYAVSLGTSTRAAAALAQAITFLNNPQQVAAATASTVTTAINNLTAAAAKLNLQVVQTAGGVQILNNQLQQAPGKVNNLTGAFAYLGGRSTAMLLGFSQLGFELGVLGRAVTALAPYFASAFVVAAPVLVAEAISGLIEKYEKLIEEVRKGELAFDEQANSAIRLTETYELQNVKLDDQIAKLEGRPETNKLASAVLEVALETDELNKKLETALEKTEELLKAQEIGVFKGVLLDQETTSDFKKNIDSAIEAYQDAMHEKQAADLGADEQAKASAAQEVTTQKNKLSQLAIDEKNSIKDRMTAREKALQQPSVERQANPQAGAPNVVPGLSADDAIAKTKGEYRELNRQVNDVFVQIKELDAAQVQQGEHAKKVIKEGEDAQATANRERERTIKSPDIKIAEDAAKQKAEIAKEEAQQAYTAAQARVKAENDLSVEAGNYRSTVDLDSNAKQIANREALRNQLQAIQKDYFKAEIDAISAQGQLISQTETGDKRAADLKTNSAKVETATRANAAAVRSINAAADLEEFNLEATASKDRIAIRNKENSDVATETRTQTQLILNEKRDAAATEIGIAQQSSEAQLRYVDVLEGERVITAQQAYEKRVKIYETELSEITAILDEEKKAIIAQQEAIRILMDSLPTGSAEFKNYLSQLKELDEALSRINKQENSAKTSTKGKEDEAQIRAWKARQKAVTDFVNQSENALGQFAVDIFTTNQGIAQSFNKMMLQIERQFIQMITRMILESALFTKIRDKIQHSLEGVFDKIGLGKPKTDKSAMAQIATQNVAEATSDAAVAASGQFAYYSITDPPAAPAMAAAAYAQGLIWAGLAAFEKGGIVDGTGPILAHDKEMVLPAHISQGLQTMISTRGDSLGKSSLSLGDAGTNTTSSSVSVGRMIFSPNIKGDFDPSVHGEQLMKYVTNSLRKKGMSI